MQPQVIDEKAISYSQYKGSALVDIVLRDIPKVTVTVMPLLYNSYSS